MLREAISKINAWLSTDFTMLWAVLFYGSILFGMVIAFTGQYAILLLTIAFISTDVSLTYRSFILLCEKHPEKDRKIFYTLEMNPAVKFMVSRFGLFPGGIIYVAICTVIMALILSSTSLLEIGLLIGMYFLIIFTHIENIRYFSKLEPASKDHKHLSRCCLWAEGKL